MMSKIQTQWSGLQAMSQKQDQKCTNKPQTWPLCLVGSETIGNPNHPTLNLKKTKYRAKTTAERTYRPYTQPSASYWHCGVVYHSTCQIRPTMVCEMDNKKCETETLWCFWQTTEGMWIPSMSDIQMVVLCRDTQFLNGAVCSGHDHSNSEPQNWQILNISGFRRFGIRIVTV